MSAGQCLSAFFIHTNGDQFLIPHFTSTSGSMQFGLNSQVCQNLSNLSFNIQLIHQVCTMYLATIKSFFAMLLQMISSWFCSVLNMSFLFFLFCYFIISYLISICSYHLFVCYCCCIISLLACVFVWSDLLIIMYVNVSRLLLFTVKSLRQSLLFLFVMWLQVWCGNKDNDVTLDMEFAAYSVLFWCWFVNILFLFC